jgi:hypothetical protein
MSNDLIRIVEIVGPDDARLSKAGASCIRTGRDFDSVSRGVLLADDGRMFYHIQWSGHAKVLKDAQGEGGPPFLIVCNHSGPGSVHGSGFYHPTFEYAGPAPSLDGPQPD